MKPVSFLFDVKAYVGSLFSYSVYIKGLQQSISWCSQIYFSCNQKRGPLGTKPISRHTEQMTKTIIHPIFIYHIRPVPLGNQVNFPEQTLHNHMVSYNFIRGPVCTLPHWPQNGIGPLGTPCNLFPAQELGN